jgi:Leucine-rich repeat (LRR) protein
MFLMSLESLKRLAENLSNTPSCLQMLTCIVSVALLQTCLATSYPCPTECNCRLVDQLELTIDCQKMTISESSGAKLLAEIDVMMMQTNDSSTPLLVNQLTALEIVNSPLADVPLSICHLRSLRRLRLDRNRLRRFPGNCFVHLTQLVNLTAVDNEVAELQDGLFDGLSKLELLDFSRNRISSIGRRVFINESDLLSLYTIHLDSNYLTDIDIWPIVRGRAVGTYDRRVFVGLSDNFISTFTNTAGVPVICGSVSPFMSLDLKENRIERLADLMHGFGVPSFTDWLCILGKDSLRKGRPRLHMEIAGTYRMICDCVDFEFYRAARTFTKSLIFARTFCVKPDDLYSMEIPSIPLDRFVCDVTERCPAGCRCVFRPANATLHVYCSSSNLTKLPTVLPPLPRAFVRYKFDFQNIPNLNIVEYRDYFANLSSLDASHSGVETVDPKAWQHLVTTSFERKILLNGNRLKSLPRDAVTSINVSHGVLISLDGNPWSCSCNDRWMASWLKSVQKQIVYPDGILCNSPERLAWTECSFASRTKNSASILRSPSRRKLFRYRF